MYGADVTQIPSLNVLGSSWKLSMLGFIHNYNFLCFLRGGSRKFAAGWGRPNRSGAPSCIMPQLQCHLKIHCTVGYYLTIYCLEPIDREIHVFIESMILSIRLRAKCILKKGTPIKKVEQKMSSLWNCFEKKSHCLACPIYISASQTKSRDYGHADCFPNWFPKSTALVLFYLSVRLNPCLFIQKLLMFDNL